MRSHNVIAIVATVIVSGCSSHTDERFEAMSERLESMAGRVEQLEAERGEVDPAATSEVAAAGTLELRSLSIVDESGVPMIYLHAGEEWGSQIWLADQKQKRILLTARQPIPDLGNTDITGVLIQDNGVTIQWQTPPIK
tara:strand:- start:12176 stop:12592 length:417 start_codon:yes stop_codon:yes gene_type:complete